MKYIKGATRSGDTKQLREVLKLAKLTRDNGIDFKTLWQSGGLLLEAVARNTQGEYLNTSVLR